MLEIDIPTDRDDAVLTVEGREVKLTNLRKPFWPEDPSVPADRPPRLPITKGDLLRYYAAVSDALLPHIRERAMVMKRYPHGAFGKFFFMKRAPTPRPPWIETIAIEHSSGNVIDFPVINDVAALLWVINLGCIDLNPWYARRDDVHRPDYLHFDLDPGEGASWKMVLETAQLVHEALDKLGMPNLVKTSGSKGLHIYVPIVRGPLQKEVWTFAKALALALERRRPVIATAVYRIAKRPKDRVLVDYNQNAWGRTLASIYSVRPKPRATVSAPVSWDEIGRGAAIEDFRIDNVPDRVRKLGDLWEPIVSPTGRFDLKSLAGSKL